LRTACAGDASDPGLAELLKAWPALPEHIKAAVAALVKSLNG